jgi:hypothetical protein
MTLREPLRVIENPVVEDLVENGEKQQPPEDQPTLLSLLPSERIQVLIAHHYDLCLAISAHQAAWEHGTWSPVIDVQLREYASSLEKLLQLPPASVSPTEFLQTGTLSGAPYADPRTHAGLDEETRTATLTGHIQRLVNAIRLHEQLENRVTWEHHLVLHGAPRSVDARMDIENMSEAVRSLQNTRYRNGIERQSGLKKEQKNGTSAAVPDQNPPKTENFPEKTPA